MNLNKVYLVGTLKSDPETRETHSGSSVTRVVVQVFRDYFSKERNQRVRETDSFEVQAWGQPGQQIAAQFKRGAQILVEGRLKQDTWETPTGERRQRTVVHLESFAPVGAGGVAAPVAEGGAPAEEGPTPTAGEPGASGKRKRRRRRGPRRDGLPAGPVTPQTPEERALFAAGITDAATAPAPAAEAPAPTAAPPKTESAPTSAAPAPASTPPPPPPPAEKPKPATSLKEDMPF